MRSRILDVLAALFVATIFWVPPLVRTGRWAAAPLVVGVVAAVLLARRFPAPATIAAVTVTITGTALGVCADPMLAAAWCLFPLAFRLAGRVRAPLAVLTGLIAGLAVVAWVPDHGRGRQLLLSVVALTLSWLLGTMVGRQVTAERARVHLAVARDVHDVVGHALATIGAEAGVTRSLPDATDQELRDSLAGIERHARGALAEVQTLVRALRSPDPTLDQLGALVTAVRSAGVRVEAHLSPTGELDPRVAASLFRIAQEALSNVVKHAPGAHCDLTLTADAGDIVLTVQDTGPPSPAPDPAGSVSWGGAGCDPAGSGGSVCDAVGSAGLGGSVSDPAGSAGPGGAACDAVGSTGSTGSSPDQARSGGSPDPARLASSGDSSRARAGAVSSKGLAAGGSGLIGMRERARLNGGTVTWAPTGPGFRVEARLPRRSRR
ncbi:histidine kinase [Actinoplanes sp. NPDC051411]|uniref:sensor histidine kinase n=1 Tax=Actinoplanes sp. NPDC051411 TaxID=3155522 RepID=UPI00343BF5F2